MEKIITKIHKTIPKLPGIYIMKDGHGGILYIGKALDGDSTAIRLYIERLVLPRKDRPVNLDLPQMQCVEDTIKAMAVISSGVADGELTLSEGQVLSGMVENYRKAIETTELEERISNLEKRKN